MTVIAVIVLMTGLTTSGLRGFVEGNRLSNALIGITGALENARQAAIAGSTYTWVGMNSSRDAETGQNTITVAVFASGDGTRNEGAQPGGASGMKLISRVEKFEAVKLLNSRPADNGVGDPSIVDAPSCPEGSPFHPNSPDLPSKSRLNFDWVVLFTPRGEACVETDATIKSGASGADGDSLKLTGAVQFWVSSSKGDAPSSKESKSASLVQVSGVTGQVDVFQPL